MFLKTVRLTALMLVACWVGSAQAGMVLNLTTANSSGSLDGGYFFHSNPQPTGTGNFDAFLQIGQSGASNNPVERAYNSDRSTQLFQQGSSAQHNHAVQLSTIPFVTFANSLTLGDGSILPSGQYYEFILDVNQQANQGGTLLSLAELQVFATTDRFLTNYSLTGHDFGVGITSLFDLGGRVDGDQIGSGLTAIRDGTRDLINVDYGASSGGSGSGDLTFLLPTSLFASFNQNTTFITLSNVIGLPNTNNDGFEEWGFIRERVGTPSVVPEPSTIVSSGIGLVMLGAYARYRRRKLQK